MRIPERPSHWLPWLALIAALVATALVYWPGTHGGFLLDDYPNIVNNPAMHSPALTPAAMLRAATSTHTGPTDRPIAMMSFALNAHFTGLDPQAMKLTNLAIHLINGVLVFLLLRLLLGEYARLKQPEGEVEGLRTRTAPLPAHLEWTALAVTAAWLLTPINLTAVLYTVQRMTSLAATFTLAALVLFCIGRRWLFERRRRGAAIVLLLAAALVFTPLSVLTKESGVLTLVYALVIEWVFSRFRNGPRSEEESEKNRRAPAQPEQERPVAWEMAGYFTIFLLVPLIIGLWWLVPGIFSPGAWAARDFTLGERLLTEGRVIWHYLYWTLVPDTGSMTLYHDAFPAARGLFIPWSNLPAWFGIAALLAAGFAAVRRLPLVGFGILWFLVGQALTASFIPLELVFEHREYLPSLGLLLALFSLLLLARPPGKVRRLLAATACALVLLYAGSLALRSLNWSNPLVQTALAARTHPQSPRATYAYGRMLANLSRRSPAFTERAEKALEAARRVPEQGIIATSGLIILANADHRPLRPEWFQAMAAKLAAHPPSAQDTGALNALVHCAIRDENPCRLPAERMQAVFHAALDHRRRNTKVQAIYGNYLLNALDRPRTAAAIFRGLVKRHPRDGNYRFSLGVCLAQAGDADGARRELAILRRLNRYGIHDPEVQKLSHLIARLEK